MSNLRKNKVAFLSNGYYYLYEDINNIIKLSIFRKSFVNFSMFIKVIKKWGIYLFFSFIIKEQK